ncbi:MAG: class I SAM-dependent methyltransferase [Nitrospirota bacterium]|nr:class I SAM-dependent methyltransferase [Nitrospirota bacterium]
MSENRKQEYMQGFPDAHTQAETLDELQEMDNEDMKTTLKHRDANVVVEELASGKKKIHVEIPSGDLFMTTKTCETSYPLDLIDKILSVKGPAYLCDEILRDESPDYVQKSLKYDLLSYLHDNEFKNKRLLDFGCGSGASTMILARMFPHTEIVGIELEEKLLSIAKLRANHYGYNNIELLISSNPDQLPPDTGYFDYIILSAVYEHLLPNERAMLLPKLWSILKTGGILFLNQTPYRYFPVETHTTSGLPFINYLPDRAALFCTRHFSKRKLKNNSWQELLRKGIRGGSIKEISKILSRCSQKPLPLNPYRFGIKDRIDLWYIKSGKTGFSVIKKSFLFLTKSLNSVTGISILPSLSLAIKKSDR